MFRQSRGQVSPHSLDVQRNILKATFFHGSQDRDDVREILARGFNREWSDGEGRWFRDGNLGIGTYLSCDWRTALWFGHILIQATVKAGTRIVDTSLAPDMRILEYLRREFGAQILSPRDPSKVIPSNKHLTREQFFAVLRYHYHATWTCTEAELKRDRWSGARQGHDKALKSMASRLYRYGYHGYGHPADDNGILIFQPERILVKNVILDVPQRKHWQVVDASVIQTVSLRQLSVLFPYIAGHDGSGAVTVHENRHANGYGR